MSVPNIILQSVITLVVTIYYLVEGIIFALLPASILPKKDIRGWTCLITGAGSGFGRLMAIRFGKLGCKLVLWDINEDGNNETARLVKQYGVDVHTYTTDLSKREDIYRVADKVKKEVGDVDLLVNNAGIVTGRKLLQCPDNLIQKTMDVNTMAIFYTAKAFLPAMIEKNKGHLVTVASIAGFCGVNGLADYCASKAGAVFFDDSIRMELDNLGKTGVKVTTVAPYYANTGMFTGVAANRVPWLVPILEPEYVVDKVVAAVQLNQEVLIIPRALYFLAALKSILPVRASIYSSNRLGFNQSMDEFVGRQKQK